MTSIRVHVVDVNGIAGVSGCLDVGEVEVPHDADAVSVVIVAVVDEVRLVVVVGVEAAVAKNDGRVWKSIRDRTTIRKRD